MTRDSRPVVAWRILHQRANHARDERGTHAVSHHIAHKDTDGLFTHGEDTEEIAAYVASGEVKAEEAQGALVNGDMRGNGRKMLRQQRDLKFARHLELFLHLLVLFAELARSFLHASFKLRVQREQLALGEIAPFLGPVDSSTDPARDSRNDPRDQDREGDGAERGDHGEFARTCLRALLAQPLMRPR